MVLRPDDKTAYLSRHADEVPAAVDAQLSTANLVVSEESPASGSPVEFATDADFWRRTLDERLRSGSRVRLAGFRLLEWFPRSPGLFYTRTGWGSRVSAVRERYPESNELVRALRTVDSDLSVYNVRGKTAMLEGGYGCIRLRDKVTDQGRLWFMAASSSAVAHEGVPVGLPEHIRDQVIEEIHENGCVRGNLDGRLLYVPELLNPLYCDYRDVPQLYLLVDRFERIPAAAGDPAPAASAAVTFAQRSAAEPGQVTCSVAYVPFRPGRAGDLDRRRRWLEIYVEHHDGRVITDFDEHRSQFPHAPFSLEKISQGRLAADEILAALRPVGSRRPSPDAVRLNVERLIVNQSQLHFHQPSKIGQVMGDSFANIGAGAVVINRSLLTNAMNRVAGTDGATAAALREIAEHVQQSGNADAGDNLEGLMEELERAEPRRSRLKTFWDGLVAVLPGVVQLGAASEKMIELVTK